jgi:hypothetical protein
MGAVIDFIAWIALWGDFDNDPRQFPSTSARFGV